MTKLWERLKAVFGNRDKKAANRKAKGARKAPKAAKAKAAPKEKAETKAVPQAAKAKAPKAAKGAKEVKEVKAKVPGKEVPPDARLLSLAVWAAGQTGDPRLPEIVSRRLASLRRHERTMGAYAGVCRAYADMVEALDPAAAATRLKAGWWDWAVSVGYGGDFTPPRSLRGRVGEREEA